MSDPNLWLDPIPPVTRPQALEAFANCDAEMFLSSAPNDYGLALVYMNARALQDAGIYEKALLTAFYMSRGNNSRWSLSDQRWLFEMADRERLIAAGNSLPEGKQFTLYRGVAGKTSARRVRGLSWTDDLERARWFAKRGGEFFALADPAVFCVTVDRMDIYAHITSRGESEYVVLLTPETKVKRLI